MNKEQPFIFAVYGTLKRGFGNNRLLRDAIFLGEHTTEPKYTMYSAGGFPIVKTGGQTAIKCELFATDNKDIIEDVNSLEGYRGKNDPNNWYDRMTIETKHGPAEMFVMHKTGNERPSAVVETGEWQNQYRNY